MKVAIVCDDLIQWGGAEEVVKGLSEIFPEAPIYTTVASNKWKKYFSEKNRRVVTSFLQKFPFAVYLNRYYSVFNFDTSPLYFEFFRLFISHINLHAGEIEIDFVQARSDLET